MPRLLAPVFVFVLLLCSSGLAAADGDAARRSFHLRTSDDAARALVEDGLRHSATVRRMVTHLLESDVIVYVVPAAPARPGGDGRLTFLASGGGYRYVVISVNMELPRIYRVAVLGHELQHAVEVADSPGIVDGASLARAFWQFHDSRRLVRGRWITFDTDAAVQAGLDVLRDLRGSSMSAE